jgi:hypothetical protein
MDRKSDEEISLFVRNEQTGRVLFNARALRALGHDLAQIQQRGYLVKELEATKEVSESRREEAT